MSVAADLRADLEIVWSADTAHDPTLWSLEVPSTGQCAVTALIVDALLGGEIVVCDLGEFGSHYANVIDEELVDLTADQFDFEVEGLWETVSRESLIFDDGTFHRFTLLSARLQNLWASRQHYLRLVVNG